MGLPGVPDCIRRGNLEMVDCCCFRVMCFILLYGHYYETGALGSIPSMRDEWIERTGGTAARETLWKAVKNVFYPMIAQRRMPELHRAFGVVAGKKRTGTSEKERSLRRALQAENQRA